MQQISRIETAVRQNSPQSLFHSIADKVANTPVWLIIILSLLARIWLLVHTKGVIEADEAWVGIQALHITQGDRPVYYYEEVHLGSLEAYLMAIIFEIAGSSVWSLRAEPIILSILLIFFTWKFAKALASWSDLPVNAQKWFVLIATGVAAIPPLDDTLDEMITTGGYIEIFILMLILLFLVFRLTTRWQEGASRKEIFLWWAGIGFVIGLGLWIHPIIGYAIVASFLWISGSYILWLITARKKLAKGEVKHKTIDLLMPVAAAIPSGIIGALPAIIWGAENQWRNVTYIFQSSGGISRQRITAIYKVTNMFLSCVGPRVIGGALPNTSYTPARDYLLIIGVISTLGILSLIAASLFWHSPTLRVIRRLTGLPMLFGICVAVMFCTAKITAEGGLFAPCSINDAVGRYAVPLGLVLPFFIAALFTLLGISAGRIANLLRLAADKSTRFIPVFHAGLAGILLIYFAAQIDTYIKTSPNYTFQSSGCFAAPADNRPIISYMEQNNIHFAWANWWVGSPISFSSNEKIITTDPRYIPEGYPVRIPAYTRAVMNADRPSIISLAQHGDRHPQVLQKLDQEGIIYTVKTFYSEPGVDLLVITPLNRSVTPTATNDLGSNTEGCY